MWCQSIHISSCKFSVYFTRKNLFFLFYTTTYIKHPHQFFYFTRYFNKIITFLIFLLFRSTAYPSIRVVTLSLYSFFQTSLSIQPKKQKDLSLSIRALSPSPSYFLISLSLLSPSRSLSVSSLSLSVTNQCTSSKLRSPIHSSDHHHSSDHRSTAPIIITALTKRDPRAPIVPISIDLSLFCFSVWVCLFFRLDFFFQQVYLCVGLSNDLSLFCFSVWICLFFRLGFFFQHRSVSFFFPFEFVCFSVWVGLFFH